MAMGVLVSNCPFHAVLASVINGPNRIVAIVGGLCLTLLFLLVPETFWDRTPRPKARKSNAGHHSFTNLLKPLGTSKSREKTVSRKSSFNLEDSIKTPRQKRLHDLNAHARFADDADDAPADQKTHLDVPSSSRPVTPVTGDGPTGEKIL